MAHSFGSLDDLGEGPGFRKVRRALGVSAFGVNGVVYPPGFVGFEHFHDTQDELYFVHSGSARFEVDREERVLGPGGLCYVESTTPRRVSNASSSEDLVLLVVGGKDGYVERDGHMTNEEDVARRIAFSGGESR
jgi:mannose-6-phosphate isomerase-like protein (cupin superfamily)